MVQAAPGPEERLRRTERVWRLMRVSREEAVRLLLDKEEGNFLVRGCRQPGTLALSLVGSLPPGEVQHFILIRKVDCIHLEGSDLEFPGLVALLSHYSSVCEELPCRLRLPAILATCADSAALDSLALLGKDFWNYPMSQPGRRSLLLPDSFRVSRDDGAMQGAASDGQRSEGPGAEGRGPGAEGRGQEDERWGRGAEGRGPGPEARQKESLGPAAELAELSARLSRQLEELSSRPTAAPPAAAPAVGTGTPPRPPRRSCGRLDTPTTSPLSTPPARQRRRVSDSAVSHLRVVEPARAGPRQRHSLAGRAPGTALAVTPAWVSSPIFPAGGPRQRKGSVFAGQDRLAAVEESVRELHSLLHGTEDTVLPTPASGIVTPARAESPSEPVYSECGEVTAEKREPEGDYSEPVDRVSEVVSGLYCSPGSLAEPVSGPAIQRCRPGRCSDGALQYRRAGSQEGRKVSLGGILRKLSRGRLPGPEDGPARHRPDGRRSSRTEERLSSVLRRLVSGPRAAGRQVDSSSWEFLPSCGESSTASSPGSTAGRTSWGRNNNKGETTAGDTARQLQPQSSSDSMYESEYDSSTGSSSLTSQSDSAFSSVHHSMTRVTT